MLPDEQLDQLAAEHVRTAYQFQASPEELATIIAERQFLVPNPPGAFYVTRAQEGFILGTAGFFVSRADGSIRHLSPAEIAYAVSRVAPRQLRPYDGTPNPVIVEWLLLHPDDEGLLQQLPTEGSFPQRRWWQFWKPRPRT